MILVYLTEIPVWEKTPFIVFYFGRHGGLYIERASPESTTQKELRTRHGTRMNKTRPPKILSMEEM